MTALRVRLWFWQLITHLSYFSQYFYTIKNFFFLLWVNLYMITETYLHDPPPFNSSFFMTPPFSAVSKSCNPPSVSTPPPPPLISDKSLSGKQKIRQFWITQKFLYTCASNCTLVFLMSSRNSMRTWVHFSAMIFNVTARLDVDRTKSLIRYNDRSITTCQRLLGKVCRVLHFSATKWQHKKAPTEAEQIKPSFEQK